MRAIILYLVISSFTICHSVGQEALTFEAAIEAAMANNFDIKIAKNNLLIAETNAHPGASGLLPVVAISAATNYSLGNTKQTFLNQSEAQKINGASTLRNNANIGLSYVLFDGMQNINGFKRLKEEANRASLQRQFQMEQVALQVAQLYYNLAQAEELHDLNKRIGRISSKRFERTSLQSEYGQSKRLELNANIDFITDSINSLNSQNNIENLKAQLNTLLGREPSSPIRIQKDITLVQDFVLENLLINARNNNKALLLSQKGIDIAELELKLSKQGNYPSLVANTGYGVDEFNSDAGFLVQNLNYGYQGGLTFNYNIFDGNVTRRRKQAAMLINDNAQLSREQLTLQTESNILNAFNDYQTALTILDLQSENLEKVMDNFSRSEQAFRQGSITSLEYRDAQLGVARAESIILQSKYNAKILEYRLLQLSGNLLD